MLFTVSGAVARPGVYEAPLGTQLKAILATAGGLTSPPKAFLVGGYAGGWIDAPSATQLALDETSLRSHGLGLGVGAIFAFPDHACGLCQTARVARYLANESAAQCGPCIHGLDAIASRLERPGRQGPVADRAALTRWAAQVTGRGACRHPDGTARFVASALTVFRDELNEGHDPTNCRPGRVTLLPIPTSDEP
jgi:NADH:ubiquinone oxidoreductase subunit F (NADH-binding)